MYEQVRILVVALTIDEAHGTVETVAKSLYSAKSVPATAKSVRTSFSPSPIHLLVKDELDMEKKVAPLS